MANLHNLDEVLSNEKWDSIIVCIVPVREREWGERRNVHYCTCQLIAVLSNGIPEQKECCHAKVGMFARLRGRGSRR